MSTEEHQDKDTTPDEASETRTPATFQDPLEAGRNFVKRLQKEQKPAPEIDPEELAEKTRGSFLAALAFANKNQDGPSK